MVNILEQVRDFLTKPEFDIPPFEPPRTILPVNRDVIFESHITEVKQSTTNQAVSLAYDETEGSGIAPAMRRGGSSNLTEYERKETLLNVYLNNTWVSSCVDAIAMRITSGGFAVEPVEQGEGDEKNEALLRKFCLRINEHWDFLQFIRSVVTDLLIFGEAYAEIVWNKGVPFKMYKIDCLTMTYKLDPHGMIVGYEQQLSRTVKPIQLDPNSIIRWWLPHPRANMLALSPIEKSLDAVNLEKKMLNWLTTFFQKGAKAPFWIKGGGDEEGAKRFLKWFRETFTGEKNAHVPITTFGDAEIKEFQRGAIDVDFPTGFKLTQQRVLATYKVPPATLGIIESGNIGGGTGEAQDKSLQFNACDPVKQMVMETFNFRIVQEGFGITDYMVRTQYADYRSDDAIVKVQDTKIKNGTLTPDEARQEEGKKPYPKGGDVPFIWSSKEVIPLPRLSNLEDEQRTNAQLDIEQKKVAIDKAKNPPPPPPMMPPPNGTQSPQGKPAQPDGQPPAQKPPTSLSQKQQAAKGKQPTQESTEDILALVERVVAERLQEYNDNHDARGQFAGGSGALSPEKASHVSGDGPINGKNQHTVSVTLGDGSEHFTDAYTHSDVNMMLTADHAYVFHGSEKYLESVGDYLDDHPDSMIQFPDGASNKMVMFTNHEIEHEDISTLTSDYGVGISHYARDSADVGDYYSYANYKAGSGGSSTENAQEAAKDTFYADSAWQNKDAGIQAQLKQLQEQGITHTKWHAQPDACATCLINDNETRPLGMPYPNGCILPECHPSCACVVEHIKQENTGEK